MDTKILVDKYITEGKTLLKNLDSKKFPVNAAMWFYDQNSDSWKYVISSSRVDEEGPLKVYQDIQSYLGNNIISLKDISVVSPNNNLVVMLKKAISTGRTAISGIRFSKNTINNYFIEDAYIYRMT
ncbi:hypothetical protein A3D77_07615 [Candidatus Gottesmanbacteria bacterium RIFCSPHIGHO2_02_FULL_39_11]|uniref:Uncharacterized protein n=1 Tax=Candidatus Gottesmanbacteria bacterium RIFCSPHIGHO2_02_FULL_39_11 TaxID=1798382 RepID=A0A1F5ZSC8_9BACT|nr:MAG: hypothetical protein A3D77_07615 [Candidatus Gottesmanbacteria bacterium RIFCSPHIGHO2_02_FULL_39_11]